MLKNKQGAGFVIFNKSSPEQMLALIREDGLFDIPKGRRDDNESDLEAARRECFEECSIMIEENEMLPIHPYHDGVLTVFGAETDKIPVITPNIHSGILEHTGYKWLNKKDFCSACLPYLKSPVIHFYATRDKTQNS